MILLPETRRIALFFSLLIPLVAGRLINGSQLDVDVFTSPINDTSWTSDYDRRHSVLHARQDVSPEWLRIMPLGASIVSGTSSSPEDGFRKPLRDHLRSIGFKVNMVGSQ